MNIELILKKFGHKHVRPSRKKTKCRGKKGGGGIETLVCCSQHYIRAQQKKHDLLKLRGNRVTLLNTRVEVNLIHPKCSVAKITVDCLFKKRIFSGHPF